MNSVSAMTRIELPDLGEGLTEAEIVAWHVGPGDRVVVDQPLVSVETDKAVVEIPAPVAGTVAEICGAVGTVVQVGELLVRFAGATDAQHEPTAIVGAIPEVPRPQAAPRATQRSSVGERRRVRASPRARRRARELGIGLGDAAGEDADTIVRVADVERSARPVPNPGASVTEPLRGVRKAMAKRMAGAHARVARATVTANANIGLWTAKGSPMPRLVRAIGVACQAEPRLNASFDDEALTLEVPTTVNLGIAMETHDGLFVPVVEDIVAKSAEAIGTTLVELEAMVAERRLSPAQMRGQTLTLSNFGAVGGLYAEMVVVPPQVAIVGAGRAFERVVLVDGRPIAGTFLPLSLTFDHRAVTGVEACRFLNALVTDLEVAR